MFTSLSQQAVSADATSNMLNGSRLRKSFQQVIAAALVLVAFISPQIAQSQSLTIDVLVVGGGGGAGSGRGGGGGGGGYLYNTGYAYTGGSTAITVGAGGAKGVVGSNPGIHALSGGNSSFGSTFVAIGGGGGGSYEGPAQNGYVGGSGGGGSTQASGTGNGGNGTAGQGNKGGNSTNSCGGGEVAGGGGGGAGAAGQNAWSSGCSRPYNPGAGGNGLQNSISGTAVWYSGGGGGGGLGTNSNLMGANGNGGGQASYGGGGQCKLVSGNFSPENGGPGIVIIRYAGTPVATGGTITQVGGYTIHTFTSSGTFAYTAPVVFNTQPSSSSQSICLNGTATTLVSAATAVLGNTPTYQWYSNTSASTTGATLISGATSASYTPPTNVAGTKYYYVIASNNLGSATSTFSGAIVVSPVSVSGSVSANQTICSGNQPANITLTGSTGSVQWQSSTDNSTFTNITGATNTTLTSAQMGTLTAIRYYRAIVTSSPCSAATSAVVTVSVSAAATAPTSITGNSTICPGASVTLTAVGGAGLTYEWGTGNTVGTNAISGQTGATLTVSPTATTTYWVRRTATSPCTGSATGGVSFTVNISSIPEVFAATSATSVCPGNTVNLDVNAYQQIVGQDFDNINSLSYSLSSGAIGNGTVGASGLPANASHGKANSNAYTASNAIRTITFANVSSLGTYTNKAVVFNLASLSANSSNGADGADNVRCSISTDGGTTYSDEIEIDGNNNAIWSYTTGTGVAEVNYDGNNTPLNLASGAGNATTNGYSTVRINLPDALTQVRVKIRMENNSSNEIWAIDDIRIIGKPTFTYSWATVAAPSTVIATTQSTTQTPTTNTNYIVNVTNGIGCSATSQVAVTMASPSLSTAPSSGNVIWRGATSTDWNTASNWYNFDGTAYTVASAVPTNAIDVIIPANQTCVLAQPSVLSATTNAAKNVLIETGATLTLAGGTLNVSGHWTNNGTFTGSTGTVSFSGTGTATLGGTSSTTFANLSMDKSGSVTLATPVTVSGSLALNDGIIELGTNNLTLGSASVTGGSATSYVKTASTGTLSRIGGATATTFPVGNSTYNPAELTNNGTSDVFSVRVIDNVTANGTGVGTATTLAVVNRTWMISEATTGGSNASLRLYWNGSGEEINGFDAASAFVAHYSTAGSMWENMGGGAGAGYVQSTDAITSFSPFTISSTNLFAPLPVELLAFDAQCADQDIIVRWTTASEHNTLNFIVQRSEEGATWNDVQTIEAAGNSNTVLDYAIQDMGAARGTKYYRLVQTDQDGVQKIYGPILTNCGSDAMSLLTFPNPSSDEFTILFGEANIHGDVVMTVSDATGKVVRNAALFIEKGTTSMMVPSLDLSPGVYQIQLNGENFQSAIIKHSIR